MGQGVWRSLGRRRETHKGFSPGRVTTDRCGNRFASTLRRWLRGDKGQSGQCAIHEALSTRLAQLMIVVAWLQWNLAEGRAGSFPAGDLDRRFTRRRSDKAFRVLQKNSIPFIGCGPPFGKQLSFGQTTL